MRKTKRTLIDFDFSDEELDAIADYGQRKHRSGYKDGFADGREALAHRIYDVLNDDYAE